MGRGRLVPQAAPVSPEKGAIMERLKIQGPVQPSSPFIAMEMREDRKSGEDEEQQRGRESARQVKTWERMAREGGSGSQQEEEGQSLSFSACVAGGISQLYFSLIASFLHPTHGSQPLPGGSWGQEGFVHYPAAGPLTFEGNGSDHLGLNCKMATWWAAGQQLLGLVQLLDIPGAPNH